MKNLLVPVWILDLKKEQYIYNYRGDYLKIKKIKNYYITFLPDRIYSFALKCRSAWLADHLYWLFSVIFFWRRKLIDRILFLEDGSETSAILCSKNRLTDV